jgi:hypothetical protein
MVNILFICGYLLNLRYLRAKKFLRQSAFLFIGVFRLKIGITYLYPYACIFSNSCMQSTSACTLSIGKAL